MTPAGRKVFVGVLLAAAAAVSWGCWSLVLRPSGLPSRLTAPLVMLVTGVTALPLIRLDRVTPRWDRGTLGLLVMHAACDALNLITFFAAMEHASIAIAVLAHYLAPLLVALLSGRFGGPRVRGSVPAALVALAGLALVLEPWRSGLTRGDLLGAALGAVSAIGYAGNVLIATRLIPRIGPTRTMSYHALLSAALLVVVAFPRSADWLAFNWSGVALVAAGAVVMGGLAGWAFMHAIRLAGGPVASMIAFCEPLVAVIVGAIAWGERPGRLAILGAALLLGAGAAVAWSGARCGWRSYSID